MLLVETLAKHSVDPQAVLGSVQFDGRLIDVSLLADLLEGKHLVWSLEVDVLHGLVGASQLRLDEIVFIATVQFIL